MTTSSREALQQLEQFLAALFRPDELIELRFIESWVSGGKKQSRVVRSSLWLRPADFISSHDELAALAKRRRANIYFGVCPRPQEGDSDDHSIQTIRCVWCDIDSVSPEEAQMRWSDAGVPEPSIVVHSGTGIHGYWLLEQDLTSPEEQSQFAAMLPCFYRGFGGDHVQNLSRVMRPPGTFNYKNARNGRPPVPCTLLLSDAAIRYPLRAFSRWTHPAGDKPPANTSSRFSISENGSSRETVCADCAEAMELVGRLDRPAPDRSRRDFAIVCDLLRLGLAEEEIWELVSDRSKFKSNGRPYFDLTFANAERSIVLDGMRQSPSRVGT